MEVSQIALARLLLYSVILGLAAGVVYDFNRIFRVLCGVRYSKRIFKKLYGLRLPITKKALGFKSGKGTFLSVMINLGDLLCVLFVAVGTIVLNYSYNSGRFRFFTVIGACIGFLFYRSTIGKIVIVIVEPIAFISKYLFLSIFIIIGYPFAKIGTLIGKKVKNLIYLYSLTLEKKKRKLYNIKEEVFVFDHCRVKLSTAVSHEENTHQRRSTDEQK